jgi:uncharacterized protein
VKTVIVDTGPLIETFVPTGRYHSWVLDQWSRLSPPVLTCEAVISEAVFLLRREECDPDPLFAMIERGFLKVSVPLRNDPSNVRRLISRYDNVPMSVADACLVSLSEMHDDMIVFTFDSDFHVYRRHGYRTIPLLIPDSM